MKLTVSLIALTTFLMFGASKASAATYYVSQNGGGFSGGSACNGQATISIAASNGTSYRGGDLVYICGTITSGVNFSNDSGGSGNPLTIKFDTGAHVSIPMCAAICFNLGGASNIVLDGGIPCGPGTACEAAEAANPTGHPAGITGIIEATNAGSSPLSDPGRSQGIWTAGNNVEIKNIILRNFYVHSSFNDGLHGSDDITGVYINNTTNTSVHDSVIHDMTSGTELNEAFNFNFYNNSVYRMNWGIGAGTQTGVSQTGWAIHDNHFGRVDNWDEASNNAHHNRIILFSGGLAEGAGKWDGLYIYNNLFDGAAGCCSTGIIFLDGGPQTNAYIFNNVLSNAGQKTGLTNALLELTGGAMNSVWVYNNTIMGAGPKTEVQNCVQLEGTTVFVNNVVVGCANAVQTKSSITLSSIDYNAYGSLGSNLFQSVNSGSFTSLSAWRSFTKQEAHSTFTSGLSLNVDGSVPSGSPLLAQPGLNLSSVCGQNASLSALCSDTTLGHQKTPSARPSTGTWTVGAFGAAGSGAPAPPPSNRPAPPTNLGAVVN